MDEITTVEDSTFFDGHNFFCIGIGKCASSCGTDLEVLDDTLNKYSTNGVVRSQVNTALSRTATSNPTSTAGRFLGGAVLSGVGASTKVGPSGMLAGPLGAGAAIAGDVGYAVDRARELGVELSCEDILGIIATGDR